VDQAADHARVVASALATYGRRDDGHNCLTADFAVAGDFSSDGGHAGRIVLKITTYPPSWGVSIETIFL
jgi:hypothetical protein